MESSGSTATPGTVRNCATCTLSGRSRPRPLTPVLFWSSARRWPGPGTTSTILLRWQSAAPEAAKREKPITFVTTSRNRSTGATGTALRTEERMPDERFAAVLLILATQPDRATGVNPRPSRCGAAVAGRRCARFFRTGSSLAKHTASLMLKREALAAGQSTWEMRSAGRQRATT